MYNFVAEEDIPPCCCYFTVYLHRGCRAVRRVNCIYSISRPPFSHLNYLAYTVLMTFLF